MESSRMTTCLLQLDEAPGAVADELGDGGVARGPSSKVEL